jgi:hypothetical protein
VLEFANKALTVGQRRSLSNALSSVWTVRGELLVQVPENLDRLCEQVIRLAGVDVVALEALPIEEQTAELIRLARALIDGSTLAGEASGA